MEWHGQHGLEIRDLDVVLFVLVKPCMAHATACHVLLLRLWHGFQQSLLDAVSGSTLLCPGPPLVAVDALLRLPHQLITNYQKAPSKRDAGGAAPPTRSQLRLQSHTQVPAQD